MKDLTPLEIAQWFREQARMFNRMADTVDATFKLTGNVEDKTLPLPKLGQITAAQIRDLVQTKSIRVGKLAAHFGVTQWDVRKVIEEPTSGLRLGKRGWITLNVAA